MLQDRFGRAFPYLRLSITDACNFRCGYCLPNGYKCSKKSPPLNHNEIGRLVDAFTTLGVHKIRLTGGEPTVRKDFVDIARMISAYPAVTRLAFTTNGYRLRTCAQKWRDAGLTHINISIDSLNAERFYAITGHNRLNDVLAGVDAALDAGFEHIKINVVLLKDVNTQEISDFLAWARSTPICIRFIELMQTGDNFAYFQQYKVSANSVRAHLQTAGWNKQERAHDAGPAQIYTHPEYQGSIGIIAPYSKDFCTGCNRLRVTSVGDLRLCLFGQQGIGLRHLLQHENQKPLLQRLIHNQLAFKASSHFLAYGDTGITTHLASIGG